jgi:hypothetical protein
MRANRLFGSLNHRFANRKKAAKGGGRRRKASTFTLSAFPKGGKSRRKAVKGGWPHLVGRCCRDASAGKSSHRKASNGEQRRAKANHPSREGCEGWTQAASGIPYRVTMQPCNDLTLRQKAS